MHTNTKNTIFFFYWNVSTFCRNICATNYSDIFLSLFRMRFVFPCIFSRGKYERYQRSTAFRNFHLSKSSSTIYKFRYLFILTALDLFFRIASYFISFMFDLECHVHYFHSIHHTLIIIIRNAWHSHFANDFSSLIQITKICSLFSITDSNQSEWMIQALGK